MGQPMCLRLQAAGYPMQVCNRSQAAITALVQQGMQAFSTPAALAARSRIMILMLTDTQAVASVLHGEQGVLKKLADDSVVIDMGTTAVRETRTFAREVQAAGGHYLDAPVSGGTVGAADGSLAIMVGGDAAILERVRPIFQILGQHITHVGASGAGQVAKAANQMIVGLGIAAVAEALTLASQAGIDPERVRQALQGGYADSKILQQHGRRMLAADFSLGARCTTQHKDLAQALALAEQLNLQLPATQQVRDLYQQLIEQGDGDLDHAALIRLLR